MPRTPRLVPRRDPSKELWVLNIPATISPTGKRTREYFDDPIKAQDRADALRKTRASTFKAISRTSPEFIRTAIEYDELFKSVYNLPGGLKQACDYAMASLEREQSSPSLQALLEANQAARSPNWGTHSQKKWQWFTKKLEPIVHLPSSRLTSAFWTEWMDNQASVNNWNEQTYNDVLTLLFSTWKHATAIKLVSENPISAIKRRKVRKRSKPVYTVDQVRAIMHTAWHHDRELVPYYAIAIFAGLRPDVNGEIARLTWEDINFDDRWIRVGVNFDNKTGTKRFVPIEDNLLRWLSPWREAQGSVVPANLKSRREWLTKGRYGSPPGTPPDQWIELAPNGPDYRDITRHTYGSYLEAKYRDRNVVKENMGHVDFTTYEQHYRNARSPKEAEEFWNILPPTDPEESA